MIPGAGIAPRGVVYIQWDIKRVDFMG